MLRLCQVEDDKDVAVCYQCHVKGFEYIQILEVLGLEAVKDE